MSSVIDKTACKMADISPYSTGRQTDGTYQPVRFIRYNKDGV